MSSLIKDPLTNSKYRREILKKCSEDVSFREECWIKASRDFEWWCDTFVYTYDPKSSPACPDIPFVLYPYQSESGQQIIKSIGKNDLLAEKSRQMGFTWLVIAVMTWMWLFRRGQSFLIGSRKEDLVDKPGDPSSLFWKALTLDTNVLTPSGWVRNGDLRVGDFVTGSDGRPTQVTAIYDHGRREVYRVSFNDGSAVRCCGDHLWPVTTDCGRSFARRHGTQAVRGAMTTRDMASLRLKKGSTTKHSYRIPLAKTAQFSSEGPLPLPPYLMGSLLGDGCFSKSCIELCTFDYEVVSRARREVPAGCAVNHSSRAAHVISGGDSGVGKRISSLGLRGKRAWEKFIPRVYLMASAEDRLELLRGILDSDGWVQSRPGTRGESSHVYFETTSPQLATDVVFLVRSLGGFAHEPKSYPRHYTYKGEKRAGRRAYRFGITMPANPFFLRRKAEKYRERPIPDKVITGIERDGDSDVRCITVDAEDHLYVVEGFSVTHNCDYILSNLPGWMRPGAERTSCHLHNIENNSTIDGESTNENFARGGTRTAIFLDEFPAVDNGYQILRATRDATHCRLFIGTPAGAAGAYYDTRLKMMESNPERIMHIHWTLHPDKSAGLYTAVDGALQIIDTSYKFSADYPFVRDGRKRSPWYDEQERRSSSRQELAQEVDIDYAASGWQFFESKLIERLRKETVRAPQHEGEIICDPDWKSPEWLQQEGARLKLWFHPEIHKGGMRVNPNWSDIVCGVDTATGKGGDKSSNSVAVFSRRLTGEKLAQFSTNMMSPPEFCLQVLGMCRWFNNAYLVYEENGPGGEFSKQLKETDYRNVFYRNDDETKFTSRKTRKPGWWSTKESKRILLSDYAQALIAGKFVNRSDDAIIELGQYVHEPNGAIVHSRAKTSNDPTTTGENHGDMVIADALCWKGMGEWKSKAENPKPEVPEHSFLGRRQKYLKSLKPERAWGHKRLKA